MKQLKKSNGLVFYQLHGLSTLTGWESIDAMKAFRNNGSHLGAMKYIKKIGLAKSITWETEKQPSWIEAKEKLDTIQFK